jgi:hypothetical protein
MDAKYLGVTLEVLINSLILAILASSARLLFSDIKDGKDALKIFLGGLIFGVLAAYICNEWTMLRGYLRTVIILASLAGKELYNLTISIVKNPAVLLDIIKAVKGIKKGEDKDVV